MTLSSCSLQGYIGQVLGAANTTVAHVQSLDGVLLTIQGVIDTDVNETGGTYLVCTDAWVPCQVCMSVRG
mgnify:CR=1 FL=1